MKRFFRRLTLVCAALASCLGTYAQNKEEQVDSLVRLMSAKSMQLIEKGGINYRKVTGPARFLHNDTFLLCDTALWNVNIQQIEAIGNVKILQESTVLTSDRMVYLIDEDLAQFRGTLVQLEDKDGNLLRTRFLDYNTKDSVAIFKGGGAMRDKDGQVIESLSGRYDSPLKTFTFTDNVNMFTDSIFVRTTRIVYNTDENCAVFGAQTNAWKDGDMLSADAGWYDRNRELFLFNDDVHVMTKDQEAWSDSLYFHRNDMNVEMLGKVQIIDTTRKVTALAGRLEYLDSLSQVTLTREPSVIAVTDTTGNAIDTVYVGADVLSIRSLMRFQIDSSEIQAAQRRKGDMATDALAAYRQKAAEEARAAAEQAKKNNADYQVEEQARKLREQNAAKKEGEERTGGPAADGKDGTESEVGGQGGGQAGSGGGTDGREGASNIESQEVAADGGLRDPSDGIVAASDSLAAGGASGLEEIQDGDDARPVTASDSLSIAVPDSLVTAPKDSTKIGFIWGRGRVRLFREDMQMSCDTLKFNELDSLVRLHVDPIVWNEGNRQYAADSIYVSFGENSLDRAYLMSNAFVTVEEAPECYDQIRSAEMLAFFDGKGGLRRFDAMGGVDAVFYIKEDSTFATVNKSQAKLLSAEFKNGDIDLVSYFESPKNDAFPLAQLNAGDRVLKGFNWQPELRPEGPETIVTREVRPSERKKYAARPQAAFRQTAQYFPGYMDGIYKEIELRRLRKQMGNPDGNSSEAEAQGGEPVADSLAKDVGGIKSAVDTLSAAEHKVVDRVDSLVRGDVSIYQNADSLSVAADSIAAGEVVVSEKEALRKLREDQRRLKREAKEERWAKLDSLDAAKATLKAERKAEKERQKKLKTLQARDEQDRRDAERLQKYVERYEERRRRREGSASLSVGQPED